MSFLRRYILLRYVIGSGDLKIVEISSKILLSKPGESIPIESGGGGFGGQKQLNMDKTKGVPWSKAFMGWGPGFCLRTPDGTQG